MDKIGVFFLPQISTNFHKLFLLNPLDLCEPEEARLWRASVRFNARRAKSVRSVGSV